MDGDARGFGGVLARPVWLPPVSTRRIRGPSQFHEIGPAGNVTAIERTFSILKKSLLPCLGFRLDFRQASEIKATFAESCRL